MEEITLQNLSLFDILKEKGEMIPMDDKQNKWEERGRKMEELGNNMQSLGCLLTVLLTIPIVLTIILGPLGLGISIVVIILFLMGRGSKK